LTVNASDSIDPAIGELRERLTENDLRILEAVNTRLRLVAQLKDVKQELGVDFVDPAREEWLLAYLADANEGPLSNEGLRELYSRLLALTKRELDEA
jgi:3-deoxy-7-phosphoheptulonate synthase / chorismate mutase